MSGSLRIPHLVPIRKQAAQYPQPRDDGRQNGSFFLLPSCAFYWPIQISLILTGEALVATAIYRAILQGK